MKITDVPAVNPDPDYAARVARQQAQRKEFERTLETMTPAQRAEYEKVVAERLERMRTTRESVNRYVAEREAQRKEFFRSRGL